MNGKKLAFSIIITIFTMALLLSASFAVPTAAAQCTNRAPCNNLVLNKATTESLGGTWDSINSIATFSSAVSISAGQLLLIPARTTLAITGDGSFSNAGTINNDGKIRISDNADGTTGLLNTGAVKNAGRIVIGNSGDGSMGFNNLGTVENDGRIIINNTNTVSSVNGVNFGFGNSGTVNNDGKITVSNYGFTAGFINAEASATVNNNGIITIRNTGVNSRGFWNSRGIVNNYGKITINSSDFWGFLNQNLGTVNNYDFIMIIDNSGTGFYNQGTVNNYNRGQIYIGNNGISSEGFYNVGSVNNYGTVTISTSGLWGFYNGGTVSNYGAIINYSGTSGFVYNSGTLTGKPVTSEVKCEQLWR